MSSEKHPNLQLHKWAPTDYVKREEWNENFGIIDDKIGILTENTKGYRTKDGGGGPGADALNVIAGHAENAVASDLSACTIAGGGSLNRENVIGGNTANVGTNNSNKPTITGTNANYSVIGGGYDNVANGLASVITGFHCLIEQAATHGTISGGSFHKITAGDYGTISGGTANEVSAGNATIGGGNNNKALAPGAVVSGGSYGEASGNNSVIGGGSNNKAQALGSTVSGGTQNISSGNYSAVAGGTQNNASGTSSFIGGGSLNSASGSLSTVGGGTNNTANQTSATVAGGQGNTASNTGATVVGGRDNTASGPYSTAMGRDAKAYSDGQLAHADGKFVVQGDAQYSRMILRRQTTDATSTLIGLGGVSLSPQMPADSSWLFKYRVVARRVDVEGETAAWEYEGLIQNPSSGNTAFVGTPTKTVIAKSSGASSWDISLSTGADSLNLFGVGEAGKTINWVAVLELVEVIA
jgi:hypothetical protein